MTKLATSPSIGWTPNSQFIGKDGKLMERPVGAPEDVREIEASLERRVTSLLGSWPLATNRTGGVVPRTPF